MADAVFAGPAASGAAGTDFVGFAGSGAAGSATADFIIGGGTTVFTATGSVSRASLPDNAGSARKIRVQ